VGRDCGSCTSYRTCGCTGRPWSTPCNLRGGWQLWSGGAADAAVFDFAATLLSNMTHLCTLGALPQCRGFDVTMYPAFLPADVETARDDVVFY
jgi:hypothetical protein